MINFEMSFKIQRIMWIKRLLYREKSLGWKLFFDHLKKIKLVFRYSTILYGNVASMARDK